MKRMVEVGGRDEAIQGRAAGRSRQESAFFHLSIALAKVGIRISFVSTPSNLRRLPTHLIPPDLSAPLNLVELHLPPVDGLPIGGEATVDISVDQIQHLKTAYDLLKPHLKHFVSHDTPEWIIQDFASHWTAEISQSSTSTSLSSCSLFSLLPRAPS
ncbi:hypothetical protein NE237_016606 [Protea cynaroides]|uniref:Uncharacterized protein n=1 Tax=Protea cynaroides TaxID=273540 RepID=A0A9Q0K6G8_9MAGN|nr:hypothetical protein NE237_016606 [Protea cynaroides]